MIATLLCGLETWTLVAAIEKTYWHSKRGHTGDVYRAHTPHMGQILKCDQELIIGGPKSELFIFVAPRWGFSLMVPVYSLVI